jgi:hypothetical protein
MTKIPIRVFSLSSLLAKEAGTVGGEPHLIIQRRIRGRRASAVPRTSPPAHASKTNMTRVPNAEVDKEEPIKIVEEARQLVRQVPQAPVHLFQTRHRATFEL